MNCNRTSRIFLLLSFCFCLGNHSVFADSRDRNATATDGCRIVFGWDSKNHESLLDWIRKGDYAWGLEISSRTDAKDIIKRYEEGWNIVLYQLSHPESVVRYYTEKRREIPDVQEVFRRFSTACKGDTSRLFWQFFLEDDSNGIGFAQELMASKPKSHRIAYDMMQNYLSRSIGALHQADHFPKWAMAGYASSAHILAKQPEVEQITVERANDDVDDLQTGISFFRGAARQYNKRWGVDLSLWWGCANGCVHDMEPLYHKRHLYMSWYAGADHLRIEGSDLLVEENDSVTRLGKCIDEFGQFVKTHKRGTPMTNVAVILPKDHGWIISPYWRTQSSVWNYAKMPYRGGQKALDGFFMKAFPGCNYYMDPFACGKFQTENPPASPFALSCVSPKFAYDSTDVFMAEYPIPFGEYYSRNEANTRIIEEKIETSQYRPMGVSHWGDIIDVFTDNVSDDVLSNYDVVVLLDQIDLNANQILKLKKAMNNGATVLCSVGVITPTTSDFAGIKLEPRLSTGFSWKNQDGVIYNEPYRYVPCELLKDSKSLFTTIDHKPLVIEKQYGKGRLITCNVPWFEGSDSYLSNLASQLFDKIITPVQPVTVSGSPIQFMSTSDDNFVTVLLSNSTDTEWIGDVTVNSPLKFKQSTELVTDTPLRLYKHHKIKNITVPAYDLRIISLKK